MQIVDRVSDFLQTRRWPTGAVWVLFGLLGLGFGLVSRLRMPDPATVVNPEALKSSGVVIAVLLVASVGVLLIGLLGMRPLKDFEREFQEGERGKRLRVSRGSQGAPGVMALREYIEVLQTSAMPFTTCVYCRKNTDFDEKQPACKSCGGAASLYHVADEEDRALVIAGVEE